MTILTASKKGVRIISCFLEHYDEPFLEYKLFYSKSRRNIFDESKKKSEIFTSHQTRTFDTDQAEIVFSDVEEVKRRIKKINNSMTYPNTPPYLNKTIFSYEKVDPYKRAERENQRSKNLSQRSQRIL